MAKLSISGTRNRRGETFVCGAWPQGEQRACGLSRVGPPQLLQDYGRQSGHNPGGQAVSVGAVLSGLPIGMIGGLMSGALGVSSGGALVPLAVLFLNVDQHVAQGISLVAQIFPSSLAGVRQYVSHGRGFPIRWLWFVAAGFVCGGILGALCATQITSVA